MLIKPQIFEKAITQALFEESNKFRKSESKYNKRNYQCVHSSCSNPAYAKGYCNAHYLRKRKGSNMDLPVRNRNMGKNCIDCGETITQKGGLERCVKHYKNRRSRIIKTAIVKCMGSKCSKCNGEYPLAVYDFHHLYEKDADFRTCMNLSIKRISKEMAKCILVCANCHRIIHHEGG